MGRHTHARGKSKETRTREQWFLQHLATDSMITLKCLLSLFKLVLLGENFFCAHSYVAASEALTTSYDAKSLI